MEFISLGSNKNLFFGAISYNLLLSQLLKSVTKNATWLKIFWYEVFVP